MGEGVCVCVGRRGWGWERKKRECDHGKMLTFKQRRQRHVEQKDGNRQSERGGENERARDRDRERSSIERQDNFIFKVHKNHQFLQHFQT